MADAIVIGAGPNGLVGANVLADAGLDVLLLEAQPEPGGAVRSGELVEPGFTSDYFSAFYPLGIASPHLRALDLDFEWIHAEAVVSHPKTDGTVATLYRDPERTAETLAPADRKAWRELSRVWERAQDGFIGFLMEPFPPVGASLKMLRDLGPGIVGFTIEGVSSVGRHTTRHFRDDRARRLIYGNALHADVAANSPGSALFGWMLAGVGQTLGWPVPRGGAQRITDALVARFDGEIRTSTEVTGVLVEHGRAAGVRTAGGEEIRAPIVLGDVGAPALYERMLPPAYRKDLKRFEYDHGTVKVDWTLDGPIPWEHEQTRTAGTVHVGDNPYAAARALANDEIPDEVFMLLGQYASFDPGRAPAGKEVAWAYTHVPTASYDDALPDRMEAQIEKLAPGFRKLIRKRHVFTPADLEAADQNLVGGAVNGGTAKLRQQVFLRHGGRPHTHVDGLFLASASVHPGGGVHGACGANAAKAALDAVAGRFAPVAVGRPGREP